jgi:hypothetical protein
MRKLLGAIALLCGISGAAWAGQSSPPGIPFGLIGVSNGIILQNATQRAPLPTDDSTAGYAVGNTWLFNNGVTKTLYQAQSVTAGHAVWTIQPVPPLPLDVLGLTVTAATVNTQGSGYTATCFTTLAHGTLVLLTVSSGSITAVTPETNGLSTSRGAYYGAPPAGGGTAITGEAINTAISSTCTGTGATFNLTLAYPHAYGTFLLSRFYTGAAFTARRVDNSTTLAINFLSNGALDETTLLNFGAATTVRVPDWNDQGGSAGDCTQSTPTFQPTVSGFRRLGADLSMQFDALIVSGVSSPVITFCSLPAFPVTYFNAALAGVMGVQTNNQTTSMVNVAPSGGTPSATGSTGISWAQPADTGVFITAGVSTPFAQVLFRDGPNVAVQNELAGSSTFQLNGTLYSGSGGPNATGSSGGSIGGGFSSAGTCTTSECQSGFSDDDAIIVEPRGLMPSEISQLDASLSYWSGSPEQGRGVDVVVGDSQTEGFPADHQQSWVRQMAALLNRPDLPIINSALFGVQMEFELSNFSTLVTPALAAAVGPNKFVTWAGCYNDIKTGGVTPAVCFQTYVSASAMTHAAGARFICGIMPIAGGQGIETQLQTLGNIIRTSTGVCDGIIDMQSIPDFDNVVGPWTAPAFFTDGIHQTTYGQAEEAAVGAATMRAMLGWN